MWPLTALEIVNVCAGTCAATGLEALVITGVKADGTRPATDEIFIALREPAYDFDGHDWVVSYLRAGAALALVAADWPLLGTLPWALRERCIIVDDSLRAFRKLAARLRQGFTFPVIAVGGSNGKTTTKEMIAALLSAPGFRVTKTQDNLNGYTGIPLTIAQREHSRATAPHALVAEIGIDGPWAMAEHAALLIPEVAVITALGPEHLAGFSSWESAVEEELLLFESSTRTRRIFQARDANVRARLAAARRGDVIVCAQDELEGIEKSSDLVRRGVALLTFRVSCAAPLSSDVELTWYGVRADCAAPGWRGQVHVPMPGRHNADNLAAAFAAALAVGRAPEDLLRGWPSFQPPSMRCQCSALPQGGILIDDTYNASPSSMTVALAMLDTPAFVARRKVLILGDMLDLGVSTSDWHRALCEPLRALENTQLFLFGNAMREVHSELSGSSIFLPPESDPRQFLSHPTFAISGAVVLVKGSRGMRLDRVVEQILGPAAGRDEPLRKQDGGRWQLEWK